MTPFQTFRLWARRSPLAERAAAAGGALVAVGVLCWLVVPPGHPSTSAVVAGGPSGQTQTASTLPGKAASGLNGVGSGSSGNGLAGAARGGGATGGPVGQPAGATSSGGTSTGSGSTSAGSPGQVSAGSGCVSPPGSAPGVTAQQLRIAITITNIFGPAGNETFGGVSPSQAQAYVQDIVEGINASGGVACRKLVPLYYDSNPVDSSNMESNCLSIVQAGVFAEIDQGGESVSPGPQCFAQNHIPYFDSANLLPNQLLSQYYPYLFVPWTTFDTVDHNTAFGLRDEGFFSRTKGFSKLGFVYLSCYPQVISEFLGWLHDAGLSDSQIVTYDLGCPSTSIASPGDEEQAVLKFKEAGVTNVTVAYMAGSFSNFTTIAEQQNFKPKYGIPDEAIIAISYGGQHPNYDNIAGAIGITDSSYGAERTPGLPVSAATARCNSYLTSRGQPTLYQMGVITGANIGAMCDELWMFKAALEHAPVLSQGALAAGLQAVKSLDFSYPFAPNDFSGHDVTWGGQYWRATEFMSSCTCWQAIEANFHSSYA